MSLIKEISAVAGRAVELTIRGQRNFTFSFEGRDDNASAKLVSFFRKEAKARSEYDEECDLTCVYVDA